MQSMVNASQKYMFFHRAVDDPWNEGLTEVAGRVDFWDAEGRFVHMFVHMFSHMFLLHRVCSLTTRWVPTSTHHILGQHDAGGELEGMGSSPPTVTLFAYGSQSLMCHPGLYAKYLILRPR